MGMTISEAGTAFWCAGGGPTTSQEVALVIPGIDWMKLSRQKSALLELIKGDPESILWGLVHLLDEIQDQAEAAGHNVVWPADAFLKPPVLQASKEWDRES